MDDTLELAFGLPNDAWEPVAPPEGTMFLAQRRGEFLRFRPSLAVDGAELQPDATILDAANSVGLRLRQFDPEARVVRREVDEKGDSPNALQAVEFGLTISDFHVDLAQYQTLIELADEARTRRWVLCFTLTAEADAIERYVPDYQAFITSAEAVPPAREHA